MTKEEKIKEAWGSCSIPKGLEQLTGCYWYRCKRSQVEHLKDEFDFIIWDLEECSIRPKSLQGIEDNNGWISLSGDPNEIEWVANLELYNIKTKEHYFCTDGNEFIEIGRFTHYKPIVKSKPPIY